MAVDLLFDASAASATPHLLFGYAGAPPESPDLITLSGSVRFGGVITVDPVTAAQLAGAIRLGGIVNASLADVGGISGKIRFGGELQFLQPKTAAINGSIAMRGAINAALVGPFDLAQFAGLAKFGGVLNASYWPRNEAFILAKVRWTGPILAGHSFDSLAALNGVMLMRGRIMATSATLPAVQGEQGVLVSPWADAGLVSDLSAQAMLASSEATVLLADGRGQWLQLDSATVEMVAPSDAAALLAQAPSGTLSLDSQLIYPA